MGTVYEFNCDYSLLPREVIIKIAKAKIFIFEREWNVDVDNIMLMINANKNVGECLKIVGECLKNVSKV